jgi:hypothetical protein
MGKDQDVNSTDRMAGYLAAFQQMVTLTSAGPLVMIGIFQITSGDSCGICQLISGDPQPSLLSLSPALSLSMSTAALVSFIVSLFLALSGLLVVARQGVLGGSPSSDFFRELTQLFIYSWGVFFVGIVMASLLLLFSV